MSIKKLLALVILLQSVAATAAPMPVESVPDPLKTWVPWVLHGRDTLKCPQTFAGGNAGECVWPSRLALQAGTAAAQFRMEVQVYALNAGVELPGEAEHWPQEVKANGQTVAVAAKNGRPFVTLPVGAYVLTGSLPWKQMPQNLMLPRATGILQLSIDGKTVTPQTDQDGRVWLQQAARQQESRDSVSIRTYRLVSDEIPLRVTTRFDLAVAGKPREIELNAALLEGFIPESIGSALPARLEKGGSLKMQARAGNWPVEIRGRLMTPAKSLSLPKATATPEEIWSFVGRNDLRMVTVEGVASVDARQVSMPEHWKQYPAYRLRPGETMKLVETRRGNPTPNPDKLTIAREIWLDFNGAGATVQDKITGTLSRSWRLEMAAPAVLGRAASSGIDQMVTRLKPGDPLGIEVRQGLANIGADSRIENFSGKLLATGWLSDFNQVSTQLNLPPGWRLFHASGVDKAEGSWVARWTLWDFFFVLLSALAAFKLLGWRTGALLGAALVISWHMEDAPQVVWIVLLAFLALTRVLPEGVFKKLANWGKGICLAVLLVILVPYAVDQVRMSLYPSLELQSQSAGRGFSLPGMAAYKAEANVESDDKMPMAPPPPEPMPAESEEDGAPAVQADARQQAEVMKRKMEVNQAMTAKAGVSGKMLRLESKMSGMSRQDKAQIQLEEVDPNAKNQTGPGLPDWNWRSHRLIWQGPVEKTQELNLYLMPPALTIIWRLLSVVLMVASLLALIGRLPKCPLCARRAGTATAALFGLLLALSAAAPSVEAATNAAPPMPPTPAILDELRDRLTAPPDCAPNCAELSRLLISAEGARIQLRLELHALANVMLPLPGKAAQWRPSAATVDGKPAVIRRADSGTLWLALEKGVHQVVLDSDVGDASTVQIALPMAVREVRSELKGWNLSGLDAREMASGALSLTREAVSGKAEETGTQRDSLPPLVQVERTLRLGLRWTVETRIVRAAPSKAPVAVKIRLLEGESVNDNSVRVEADQAIVQLGGEEGASFVSTLKEAPKLKLVSSREANQIEVWMLDVSTQWHAVLSGIPPVLHQSGNRWAPRWQPWPGEEIVIAITKPAGEAGQTLTVDKLVSAVTPGQRASDVATELLLRSSQGGNHSFQLPEGAQLMEISINGRVQPIQAEGRKVTIPLVPGAQRIKLAWREARGMEWLFTTQSFGVGAQGVNESLHINMPQDRVILSLGGPRLGPAVLFWGVLVVVLAIAVFLGRSRFTPLSILAWFLLGLGLAQSTLIGAAVVGGWFLILAVRQRWMSEAGRWGFNLLQILLVLWTLVAAGVIFYTVQAGLLGYPDMMIEGNGSSASYLRWYVDRLGGTTAQAWVFSVPVLLYRVVMLIWALWLAASLLKWVKWAWECFGTGGYWRRRPKKPDAAPQEAKPVAEMSNKDDEAPAG